MQPAPIAIDTTAAGPDRGSAARSRSAEATASAGTTFAELVSGGGKAQAAPAKRADAGNEPGNNAAEPGGEAAAPNADRADADKTHADKSANENTDAVATVVPAPTVSAMPPAGATISTPASDVPVGNAAAAISSQAPGQASPATMLSATGNDTANRPAGGGSGGSSIPAVPPAADALTGTAGPEAKPASTAPGDVAGGSSPGLSASSSAKPAANQAANSSFVTATAAPATGVAGEAPVGGGKTAGATAMETLDAGAKGEVGADAGLLSTASTTKVATGLPRGKAAGATASTSPGSFGGNNGAGTSAPIAAAAVSPAAGPAKPLPVGAGGAARTSEAASAEPETGAPAANATPHAPQNVAAPPPPSAPAQHTATAAAAATGHDAPRPAAEQVSVHVAKAVKVGLDRIDIQLSPASLGRVEIRLDITDRHHVSASVAADSRETLDLLRADVRLLERALHDAGLKTDSGSLSFHLRDQGARAGHEHGAGGEGRMARGVEADEIEAVRPAAAAVAMSAARPAGGIDIHA